MKEAIVACISYPLIMSLVLCYVVGVPTQAQIKRLSRALVRALLVGFLRVGGGLAEWVTRAGRISSDENAIS
jgi:hypothetical protein